MSKTTTTIASSREVWRVIVRAGGLWSASDLARIAGERARRWPNNPDFPNPTISVGNVKLYTGWELVDWLDANGKVAAYARLYDRCVKMRV